MALDAALGRLARDPRDIGALIDAGNAALTMGDVDAATGFFRRADQVSPGNPRVKAGLAGAMVHNGDPFGAIPLFEEAEKAGGLDSALAGDRGLAYDLVGDNATAQRFYRQSLARMPSDEVVRRLSLSLAISGDKHNAELILSPLLQQRNLAAWRTRAFALAILGQTEEAVSIANTILPAELATGVAPYLRYMPRLTRAQQAAAANFGLFPRASEIGRDDPRVAQYAPRRGSVASADTALMPRGEPLGRGSRSRDRDRERARGSRPQPARVAAAATPPTNALPGPAGANRPSAVRVAPPEPQPARAPARVAAAPDAPATVRPSVVPPAAVPATPASPPPVSATLPARVAAAMPPPTPVPAVTPMQAPPQPAPPPAPAPAPTGSRLMAVSPGFSLAPAPQSPAAATPMAPASAAATPAGPVTPAEPAPEAAAVPRSLAAAFAEFERPSTDATPAAGAVDIRKIASAKPKPAAPAKPPPPSHPSRIWVQVATGRDKAALGFDWRRISREATEAVRGKQPFITAWGQTNRLLTGPFETEAAANSFIAQLRRADVDGAFIWTSPAGQVVDALPAAASARR